MENSTNNENLPNLTQFQKKVYKTFHDRRNWSPPSFRHVQDILGKKNHNSIFDAVQRIRKKGYEIPKSYSGLYDNNNAEGSNNGSNFHNHD